MSEVRDVLEERGKRYGSFSVHAAISQELKTIMIGTDTRYNDTQLEAIEMICHKLARIRNGDPSYKDSWVDIAGYAQLVADTLQD